MNGRENLPKANDPVIDKAGHFTQPWTRFFERLFSKPGGYVPITLTGSPFSYIAPKDGFVIVQGGTVSNLAIGRESFISSTGLTNGQFVLKTGDELSITYTVAPSVYFFPD